MAKKCCHSLETISLETTNCCNMSHDEEAANTTSCCSGDELNLNESTMNHNDSAREQVSDHDMTSRHETVEFRVHGLDCPSCALMIEKELSGLTNILEVTLSYNTAKLQIVGHNTLSLDTIENRIKRLGFEIEPLIKNQYNQTYHVEGMDCGNCAQSIEKHLSKMPTVRNIKVNFATGKIHVEHEGRVNDIISEVAKLGFKANLHSDDINQTQQTRVSHERYDLIILSGILIALGWVGSYSGISVLIPIILYATAIGISGYKPMKAAFYAIKMRSLDMNVLMTVAVIGAAIIGEWFEGATVVWLFSLGTALQNQSMEKTRTSIRRLMDLAPVEAWIKVGSELIKKPVKDVSMHDVMLIKPGEKIPLDGKIVQGETSINEAPITGESIPVDKGPGDVVYAGTINESGSIEAKVTRLVEDSTISKIIHLVEEAQEQKSPTEAFIDKFASVYTPIVFILALLVMIVPPIFNFGTWGDWAYKGLALLVVACPCALVISTPVAIVSAIGNAAKHGVLIKGGSYLERAGVINAIAFDKTGTLTEGKPDVCDVQSFIKSDNELLSIALTLEAHSTHPIAKSIVQFARSKGIEPKKGQLFKNIVGKGVQAQINGEMYYAGNLKLFESMNTLTDHITSKVQKMNHNGQTVVIVGTSVDILGIISVADTARSTTAHTIKHLKEVGIDQSIMLTGDHEGSAQVIAKETGVDRYFAGLLPEDKVQAIQELQREGHEVAMVGDGINDAPALAVSDLGIAMGGVGTDTAMETADVVLMADNLENLPNTIKLSRKALKIIKQNIWFSIIVKFIALILIFPGWLTLWMAVLSDTGAAILVILNALRLLRV